MFHLYIHKALKQAHVITARGHAVYMANIGPRKLNRIYMILNYPTREDARQGQVLAEFEMGRRPADDPRVTPPPGPHAFAGTPHGPECYKCDEPADAAIHNNPFEVATRGVPFANED